MKKFSDGELDEMFKPLTPEQQERTRQFFEDEKKMKRMNLVSRLDLVMERLVGADTMRMIEEHRREKAEV